MTMRIKEKIKEIEIYLDELSSIIPGDFDEYSTDIKTKAACERYFERVIEAVTDLAFLVIKKEKLETPDEDKQAFDVLSNEGVISKELAKRLKSAKGMRNIIAHEYGEVDDKIVFNSINQEIVKDTEEFIKNIKKVI